SQTESIDDGSFSESVDMDSIDDDFDTGNSEGGSKNMFDLAPDSLTPLTLSSPILSLGSMASTYHGLSSARVPLTPIHSSNRRDESSTLRKVTKCMPHRPAATPPPKYQQQPAAQCTPSQARSPLRTLSSHRQHIRPQSAPAQRPLLRLQPGIPPSSPPRSTMPLSCASSRAYTLMQPSQPGETPSKRQRRMGAASAELHRAADQEVSEFHMWTHCVDGESSAQLVCQPPLPGLRLHIHSVERILSPHLFSARASVGQVTARDGGLLLEEGQSISVLLSLAVCLDAAPQAARQMIQQLSSLEADSATPLLAEDSAPLTLAVYQPWRMRGEGERLSLLVLYFGTRPATAAAAALRRGMSSAAEAQTIDARLKADLKAAMKAKDKVRLPVIKGILSDILYAEKDPASGSSFSRDSDADVATIFQRAIRRRNDSIESFASGGREDLAEAEKVKLAILEGYLPTQLTVEQIEARVSQTIQKLGVSGVKAMGAVMRDTGISPAKAPKAKTALLGGLAVGSQHARQTALRGGLSNGCWRAVCQRFKSTTTPADAGDASVPLTSKTKHATEESADGRTLVTTFPNGLRITSESNPGHFAAVGVYVDAGSRYEDGPTSGYAHLMDRLAFRNSERFTSAEAMAAIEKLGGSIMSSSSRECIMYQAAVFPQDVPTAVKLLADTTLRPNFLPEDVAELQATVPWELQDVESKADMFLPEKLHEAAFRSGTLGNPLLCPIAQLGGATVGSLSRYHQRWYRPERIVVAAIGVDHQELIRLCVDNGFADLPPSPQPASASAADQPADAAAPDSNRSWFRKILAGGDASSSISVPERRSVYTGGTWFDSKPDVDFTQVYLGFKSAGIDDEHGLYVYAVLQMLLGGGGSFSAGGPGKGMYSRLYTRVLNQHAWIESCVAFHHCYTDAGLFGISASCRPRNEHALFDVMATEIEAVAAGAGRRSSLRRPYVSQEGATPFEVKRAKNQLKSNLLMNLESRMVQLEDLGRQIQVSGRKVSADAMIQHIEAITPDDIRKSASELLASPATVLAQGYVDGIRQFCPQVAANHGIKL
ncbi:Mitochondrial-processing peptidase subunit alpha, partial [Coemansia erecta]